MHPRTKVYAKHGHRVALVTDILMGTHLHLHNIHFQQGRQNGAGNALVLHQVFEHHIIDRVCNCYHRTFRIMFRCKSTKKSRKHKTFGLILQKSDRLTLAPLAPSTTFL